MKKEGDCVGEEETERKAGRKVWIEGDKARETKREWRGFNSPLTSLTKSKL